MFGFNKIVFIKDFMVTGANNIARWAIRRQTVLFNFD